MWIGRWIVAVFLVFTFYIFPVIAFAFSDPLAVPNNHFGIHILDTAEIDKAAEFANGINGDWGYVTIPIRANDRDLPKWTKFMNDCRKNRVIPILRIASFPVDPDGSGVSAHWMAPNEYDLVDFANFLNELPWPVKNRYVIVYNEPNHQGEWGGFVYPEEYARVLSRAVDIFHQKNPDFFVISAGMDASAPNTSDSMDEYQYFRQMVAAVPEIFQKIDGFSSHAYGNPGFSTPPNIYSAVSVASYRYEENYLVRFGLSNPKIFLTEVGWRADLLGDGLTADFYGRALGEVWKDNNIVAITPFLLSAADGPFAGFSFLDRNNNFRPFAKALLNYPRVKGAPVLALSGLNVPEKFVSQTSPTSTQNADLLLLFWLQFEALLKQLLD